MPFSSLGLSPALARAASELGFDQPTPIQAQAIPAIVQGRDVWASARTGSGKTAAFALPALLQHQNLTLTQPSGGARSVHTLVVVPTRELAAQVGEVLRSLGQNLSQPPKIAVLFGGVSINPQMMDLRGGADIVVATPGRLLDLVRQNAVKLGGVQLFVLDEADRLLDMGFSEEINAILALLPAKRQNLFFSATFPDSVQALADSLLIDPVRIEVASEPQDKPDIVQRAITVDVPRRTQLLRYLILQHQWERVLVFVATKYAAEHVADKLQRAGLHVGAFHGEFSQGTRSQLLADFKAGRLQVLVATDVAARGIDIAGLPAVVNYDLPRSAVDYTHRIGRTGRAGESGTAVSFVTADTEAHFRLIENRNDLRIVREVVAGFETTELPAPVHPVTDTVNGGVKGARKSKKDKLREAAAMAAKAAGDN